MAAFPLSYKPPRARLEENPYFIRVFFIVTPSKRVSKLSLYSQDKKADAQNRPQKRPKNSSKTTTENQPRNRPQKRPQRRSRRSDGQILGPTPQTSLQRLGKLCLVPSPTLRSSHTRPGSPPSSSQERSLRLGAPGSWKAPMATPRACRRALDACAVIYATVMGRDRATKLGGVHALPTEKRLRPHEGRFRVRSRAKRVRRMARNAEGDVVG
jgi:hypothetical protein